MGRVASFHLSRWPGAAAALSRLALDRRALARVPGLGPATAQRIVDHRLQHGPFESLETLLDVPGIGPATLEQMRPHLRPIRSGVTSRTAGEDR